MKYTVTSDRVAGHDKGDTIEAGDVAGHIDSLIAAGHLRPQKTKPTTTAKKER